LKYINEMKERFNELKLKVPKKFWNIINSELSEWDNLVNCNQVQNCFWN
jgi:hypothetical protein